MSRTLKDVPYKVIEKRALKNGLVDHDHSNMGQVREFWVNDRNLTKTFEKGESKAIYDYREYLKTLDNIKVEEVEGGGDVKFHNLSQHDGFYYERTYEPKTITFEVKSYKESRYTNYCTDVDHYDPVTNTDTRDGGRIVCYPEFTQPNGDKFSKSSCSCCEPVDRAVSKSKVRSIDVNAAKAFNSGMSVDDLEEMYENVM